MQDFIYHNLIKWVDIIGMTELGQGKATYSTGLDVLRCAAD